jgi:hypothetical protein
LSNKWQRIAFDIDASAGVIDSFLRSHVYRHCSGTPLAEIRVRGSGDRQGAWWLRLGSGMKEEWPEAWAQFGHGELLHIRFLPVLDATMVEMAINESLAAPESANEIELALEGLLRAVVEEWPVVLEELRRQFMADKASAPDPSPDDLVDTDPSGDPEATVEMTEGWPSEEWRVVRQYSAPLSAEDLHKRIASSWADSRHYTYMLSEGAASFRGPMYTGVLGPGDPLPDARPDQHPGTWILVLFWLQTDMPSNEHPFGHTIVTQISAEDGRYVPPRPAALLSIAPDAPRECTLQLLAPTPHPSQSAAAQAARMIQEWLVPDLIWTPILQYIDALDAWLQGEDSEEPPVEESESAGRPSVPKGDMAFGRWQKAWRYIVRMRKESLDGQGPLRLDDVRDRLGDRMGWRPSVRTIQEVIKAGDAGLLEIRFE